MTRISPAVAQWLSWDREHMIHSEVLPSAFAQQGPLMIVEGHGSTVVDATGRAFLDAQAGLCLVGIGYGREEPVQAAAEQMRRLMYYHTYWRFGNPPAVELAAELARLAPPGLTKVYFTLGGAESVETALKLARLYHFARGQHDRWHVIAFTGAYHGSTFGAMSATGLPEHRLGFGPGVPGFHHVPPGDLDALQAKIAEVGADRVAAILGEPILAVGGVITPTDTYWQAVRRLCDETGILWIADEVLTGFGRTGKTWAVEHTGVAPDLMTLAKGLTSGYLPLGAVLAHKRVIAALEASDTPFLHGFTYAGHPVACAVALAVQRILAAENLTQRAAVLGDRLSAGLRALCNPYIHEVRGRGLLLGVALGHPSGRPFAATAKIGFAVEAAALARDVIIGVAPYTDALILTPTLVMTDAEADRLLAVLDAAIREAGDAAVAAGH
jgi:adenosylmethionine-8-amino-7-oxononanoate aminotransferase